MQAFSALKTPCFYSGIRNLGGFQGCVMVFTWISFLCGTHPFHCRLTQTSLVSIKDQQRKSCCCMKELFYLGAANGFFTLINYSCAKSPIGCSDFDHMYAVLYKMKDSERDFIWYLIGCPG